METTCELTERDGLPAEAVPKRIAKAMAENFMLFGWF